ncbi:hypothetical protein KPL74_09115 [Bacillus sp. NP157]|nr:hypothetical protein KPL74_09115 [Bacillus sp. NP157]
MEENEMPIERVTSLRKRRSDIANARRAADERAVYGPAIVPHFRHATGYEVGLVDFDPLLTLPVEFVGATLEQASDWTLLHVSEAEALNTMAAVGHCMPIRAGLIGVEGNAYLGLHRASSVALDGLVRGASLIEDAVVFFPEGSDVAVVVDCYRGTGGGSLYSFYVKGMNLVACLKRRKRGGSSVEYVGE